jgi:hypothetical protein
VSEARKLPGIDTTDPRLRSGIETSSPSPNGFCDRPSFIDEIGTY